jgi:8-oxo-dGTP pyrophosphatase MutT (NUDIX family)
MNAPTNDHPLWTILNEVLHPAPQENDTWPTPLKGQRPDVDDPAWRAIGERLNNPIPAAVLVPIVARPTGLSLLLTQRTAKLNDHAGQIAFPGGKVAPQDQSVIETATREAFEEIALGAHHITPLGFLDSYVSITGYRIVPVVARISPDMIPLPHPDEVDAVFEVPLDFVLNRDNHQLKSRDWYGRERFFYAIEYDSWYIWGITAEIIHDLALKVCRAKVGTGFA